MSDGISEVTNAVGGFTGGVGGLVGGSAGGLLGGLTSFGADSAAQNIAMARLQQAQNDRGQLMSITNRGIAESQTTPEEIMALQKQTENADRTLQFAQQQLQMISQNSSLSSEQANKALGNISQLLGGNNSAALTPFTQQRQRQRDQLEGQLQREMGSGYQSSSAGQNLLANFDEQTNYQSAQLQQQALGSQLGAYGALTQGAGQAFNANLELGNSTANLQTNLLANYGNIQTRKIGALNSQANAIVGSNVAQYAGANNVGQLYRGQAAQDIFGKALDVAGSGAGKSAAAG